jgi:hypothetical protein
MIHNENYSEYRHNESYTQDRKSPVPSDSANGEGEIKQEIADEDQLTNEPVLPRLDLWTKKARANFASL